jgi:hypothetical protein
MSKKKKQKKAIKRGELWSDMAKLIYTKNSNQDIKRRMIQEARYIAESIIKNNEG